MMRLFFSVRPFSPDDAGPMQLLHERAILATSDAFSTHAQRQSWAQGHKPQGYLASVESGEIFEVATVDGKVAGFCGRTAGGVQGLYVDPDFQRRGIGRALLVSAEAAIAGTGVTVTEVRASLPAVRFYQDAGYAIAGEEVHSTRGSLILPVRLMRKALP